MDKCWGVGIVKSSSKFAQIGVEKMEVENEGAGEEEEHPREACC